MADKKVLSNTYKAYVEYEGIVANYKDIVKYLYVYIALSLFIFIDVSITGYVFNYIIETSLPIVSLLSFVTLSFLFILVKYDQFPKLSDIPKLDLLRKNKIILSTIAVFSGILSVYEFKSFGFVFSGFLFMVMTPIFQTVRKRQFIGYSSIVLISFITTVYFVNSINTFIVFSENELIILARQVGFIFTISFAYSIYFTTYRKKIRIERIRNRELTKKLQADLDFRKGAEKKLHKIQRKLIESIENEKNINQIKSDFIHSISQQYRTPLTGILNSTNIIEYAFNKQQELEQIPPSISRIYTSVRLLNKIIDDNIVFDELTVSDDNYMVVDFELLDLVKEVFNRYTSKNKYNVKSSIECKHNIVLKTKMELLIYIIDNLAINAMQYSDNDSIIKTKITEYSDEIIITINNEGQTIKENEITHVFDAFYCGSNKGTDSGIGLGLTIAKLCCEKIGGVISITSKDNITSVMVRIPVKFEKKILGLN